MKAFKSTDRIKIQVELIDSKKKKTKAAFLLAPLTKDQKVAVVGSFKMEGGKVIQSGITMTLMAIKFALKGIEGVEGADGAPYKLSFDAEGNLDDNTLDDILNIPVLSAVIINGAMAMTKGVPTELVDDAGVKLPNVEVVLDPK